MDPLSPSQSPTTKQRKGDDSEDDADFAAAAPHVAQALDKFAPEQQAELREVFQLFDQQGRGKMSCSDLRVAFRVLGAEVSREQYQAFVSIYSGDGKRFTQSEFFEIAAEVLSRRTAADKQKLLEDAFQLFDTTKAGVISAKQLGRTLTQLDHFIELSEAGHLDIDSDDELQRMLADLNAQDIGMTRADFVNLLMSSHSIM